MEIIKTVSILLATLGVLIAFHEYGHFIVARLCKVKVLEFSIGFGPKLVSFTDKHGTVFKIAALPLGGFVKMLDEREGEVDEAERSLAFNQKTVGQRIAIVSAGPIANFLLAILVYWFVFLQGEMILKPQVFSVEQESIAAEAGLEVGDVITSVDGKAVVGAQEVMMGLLERLGDTGIIELTLASGLTAELKIDRWLSDQEGQVDSLASLGFDFYRPHIEPVVEAIMPESAAEQAGLRAGDRLLSADAQNIADWHYWVKYVQARAGEAIELVVERDSAEFSTQITPKLVKVEGQAVGQVGIQVRVPEFELPEELFVEKQYSLFSAWLPAVERTWTASLFSLNSIKKMIFGQLSYKQLSGPISIAKVATQSAESGIFRYLSLLALLSVSLGVINLLPIPVLDGGHILFYLIEWVKGSPVPDQVQQWALQLGVSLVLAVMILAFVNDISRL